MTREEHFRQLTSTHAIRGDLRSASVRAAALTWVAGAGDFALRLGSTALLARLVLPEHFGLVMMVTAITSIADQFRDLGLSTVTVQREVITHDEISNLFWINVSAGAAIALIISALSPLIAAYYREPRLVIPTCLLATNFVWGGLMVQHQALLTRRLKLGYTAGVRLASSALSTALAVALAWKGFGYWALVWREFTRCALLTLGMWSALPWVPSFPSRDTRVLKLLAFGAHLSLANIVATIGGSMDRFLLGRWWGAAPTAMYRQAYQLLVLPTEQLLGPVYQVTQPGLSMLQSDALRFRRFYTKVLTVACVATMPVSLFVAVHAAEITRTILGRRWADAAPLLFVLSLSTFIKQPVGSTAFVLIAQGRSRTYLGLTLLQNAALVLLMYLGVARGAIGIALADLVATYLLIPPRLYYTFRNSPFTVRTFVAAICRPAVASIVMAAVLEILHRSLPPIGAPAVLALGAIVGVITFAGTWLFMPGGAAELRELLWDLRAAAGKKFTAAIATPEAAVRQPIAS
jgi:PST family polysaccharide transporter